MEFRDIPAHALMSHRPATTIATLPICSSTMVSTLAKEGREDGRRAEAEVAAVLIMTVAVGGQDMLIQEMAALHLASTNTTHLQMDLVGRRLMVRIRRRVTMALLQAAMGLHQVHQDQRRK